RRSSDLLLIGTGNSMVSTGRAADLGSHSVRWVCTGSITSTAWQASSLPISGSRLPARIPFPPHLPGIDDYSSRLRVSPENGLSWHGRPARAQPWEVGIKGPSGNKVYIFAAGPQARWQGASDEHTRCGM